MKLDVRRFGHHSGKYRHKGQLKKKASPRPKTERTPENAATIAHISKGFENKQFDGLMK